MNLQTKIVLAIALTVVCMLGYFVSTDYQDRQAEQARQQRIANYVPTVVITESEQEVYKRGDVVVGLFTGERFTNSNSVLERSLRCSNGEELFETINIPGQPPGPIQGADGGPAKLPILKLEDRFFGDCRLSFSQKFVEQIEGEQVENVTTYRFSFEVKE